MKNGRKWQSRKERERDGGDIMQPTQKKKKASIHRKMPRGIVGNLRQRVARGAPPQLQSKNQSTTDENERLE